MGESLRAFRRAGPTIFGVGIVAVYLVRAVYGVPAGLAYSRARSMNHPGAEARTSFLYERGAVGFHRSDALWFAAEAGLGEWDSLRPDERLGDRGFEVVSRASRAYFRAASLSPATVWPWTGLAELYGRIETEARVRRGVDLGDLGKSPWRLVGREGRVAIGMLRKAIESEPFVFVHRDDLVLLFLRLGLGEAAETAMRDAAIVQPGQWFHERLPWNELPRPMIEAFLEGAIEALGSAPMLKPERHLLSIGQLEYRLGRLEDAEAHLIQALGEPADDLAHAEHAYHLGLVRAARRDFLGADEAFARAAKDPVFQPAVAVNRARIAEADGRTRDALDHCRTALRGDPASVPLAIECARLARKCGELEAAKELLRWAIVVAPLDIRPREELFRTLLEAGDLPRASRTIEDARKVIGESKEILALQEALLHARTFGR